MSLLQITALNVLVLGDSVDRTGFEHLQTYCQEQGVHDHFMHTSDGGYEAFYKVKSMSIVSMQSFAATHRLQASADADKRWISHFTMNTAVPRCII